MESGTFADFLQQMPLALIRLLLIFIVNIIMLIIGYVLAKRREFRKKNEATQQPQAPVNAASTPTFNPPGPTANAQTSADGMPDLDMLLAMTEPPPAAAPPTATPPVATHNANANANRQPGIVTVQMANGASVEAAEVLILVRDRATNRLVVQIGEQAYSGAEAEIDPAFRRQFVGLMKELSAIAPKLGRGAKAARSKKPSSNTAPPATATPTSPIPTADATPAPTSGTLAGQIEARLQAKRRATGAFPGRSIHVMDAADGGVAIEVDGQVYDGVSAVADDDVREFIAGVVAEWQESL